MYPYSFVIEVCYFLPEDKVLQQSWTPFACAQTILVFHGASDVAGEIGIGGVDSESAQEIVSPFGNFTALNGSSMSAGVAKWAFGSNCTAYNCQQNE